MKCWASVNVQILLCGLQENTNSWSTNVLVSSSSVRYFGKWSFRWILGSRVKFYPLCCDRNVSGCWCTKRLLTFDVFVIVCEYFPIEMFWVELPHVLNSWFPHWANDGTLSSGPPCSSVQWCIFRERWSQRQKSREITCFPFKHQQKSCDGWWSTCSCFVSLVVNEGADWASPSGLHREVKWKFCISDTAPFSSVNYSSC